MISIPLLKRTAKSHATMWGVLTGVLILLLVALFFVSSGMEKGGEVMLQQFYTLFGALLPIIYIASTANKLIAQQIDNGSFAYVMSNPIKRNTVSITQAFFLIGSIIAMYTFITVSGLVAMLFVGEVLAVKTFLLLNLGSMLLNLALSAIAYFASCFFNTSRISMAIGAGIPVAFLLLRMLSDFSTFSEGMENVKYFTLYTLFNIDDIISNSSNIIWQFAILFCIAVAGYVVGIAKFKTKDLSL